MLYRHTFLRRGREPYLGQEFFVEIAQHMPESLVVFMGKLDEELVSVAKKSRVSRTFTLSAQGFNNHHYRSS